MNNLADEKLFIFVNRLATFKNWPFGDNEKCSKANMAEAGFYYMGTGDAVKCFLCDKELDGWDADDDPWDEHESHTTDCTFATLRKAEDDLTVEQFLDILTEYMKRRVRNECMKWKSKLKEIEKKLCSKKKPKRKPRV